MSTSPRVSARRRHRARSAASELRQAPGRPRRRPSPGAHRVDPDYVPNPEHLVGRPRCIPWSTCTTLYRLPMARDRVGLVPGRCANTMVASVRQKTVASWFAAACPLWYFEAHIYMCAYSQATHASTRPASAFSLGRCHAVRDDDDDGDDNDDTTTCCRSVVPSSFLLRLPRRLALFDRDRLALFGFLWSVSVFFTKANVYLHMNLPAVQLAVGLCEMRSAPVRPVRRVSRMRLHWRETEVVTCRRHRCICVYPSAHRHRLAAVYTRMRAHTLIHVGDSVLMCSYGYVRKGVSVYSALIHDCACTCVQHMLLQLDMARFFDLAS